MSDILDFIKAKDPGEKEFHQAVQEVLETVQPVLDRNPEYRQDRDEQCNRALQGGPSLPSFSKSQHSKVPGI